MSRRGLEYVDLLRSAPLENKVDFAFLNYLCTRSEISKTTLTSATAFSVVSVGSAALAYFGVLSPLVGSAISLVSAGAAVNGADTVFRKSLDPNYIKSMTQNRDLGEDVVVAINAMTPEQINEKVGLLMQQVKDQNGGEFTSEAIRSEAARVLNLPVSAAEAVVVPALPMVNATVQEGVASAPTVATAVTGGVTAQPLTGMRNRQRHQN